MARNLLKAGHDVVAFDVNADSLSALVSSGANTASSPAEVAAAASTIVTMLPSNPHVRTVYLGENGVLSDKGAVAGKLFIDCSTCEPVVSQEVAKEAAACGASLVDA